jgi:signal transduction histidine kinase
MFLAQDDDHALVLDVPDRPIWIEGDRDRLSQVVGNLVANAVKYSPGGGEIAVRAGESEGRALLEVTDHGLGIPLEDQALIFTKFYRGRAAASGIPGTGLGLAIARELVHAHGGEIEFESELGRGTTFRVELPVKAA